MDSDENDPQFLKNVVGAGSMSEEVAQGLEQRLNVDPADLASRATLISYLSRSRKPQSKIVEHMLWIVNNRPDLAHRVARHLMACQQNEEQSVREAWMQQLENYPGSVAVLKNAAYYFRIINTSFSQELLERALTLASDDNEIKNELAVIYETVAGKSDSDVATEFFKKAWQLREEVFASYDDIHRFYALEPLASCAFRAGQTQRAAEAARMLLDLAPGYEDNWFHGNAIYGSNILLGRIALLKGNFELACEHLVAASKTRGSAQLNSFGPDLELCALIFDAGGKEPVKEYILNCQKFWKSGRKKLSDWLADIEKGKRPSFDRSR